MCISHTGQCLEVIALFVLEYKISGGGAFVMGHTHSVYCGDETLLIVTFKPIDSRLFIVMIDQLNLKNCPTVYKVGLIGIESIAISLVCACAHI